MKIKQEILEQVRHHGWCKMLLSRHFNFISIRTIEVWLSNPKKHHRFTELGALNIICKCLQVKQEELFE